MKKIPNIELTPLWNLRLNLNNRMFKMYPDTYLRVVDGSPGFIVRIGNDLKWDSLKKIKIRYGET